VLAINIYLSVTLCFLILMMVLIDGLESTGMTAFPIVLLLVSLYTRRANYLIYFALILCVMIGIGLNDIYGWIGGAAAEPDASVPPDTGRYIRLLVVYSFTGFLSWILIRDLTE